MSFGHFLLQFVDLYVKMIEPNQLNIKVGAIFVFAGIVTLFYTHNYIMNLIKTQILSV